VPPELADAIVKALACSPVRCYMTLLDIELGTTAEPQFFASAEDIYATRPMLLAERFQLLLEAADDVGMIAVDSRFREDDARLRASSGPHQGRQLLSREGGGSCLRREPRPPVFRGANEEGPPAFGRRPLRRRLTCR
jgi:hypothetical protein